MKDKLIGIGVIVIAFLLVVSMLFPPSRSGDVTEYQEREILYKHQIQRQAREIKVMKSRDSVREVAYRKMQDSVKTIGQKVAEVKTVYIEHRTANENAPDSADYKSEALAGRIVIDRQEAHINALLALNSEADKLLASKNHIIAAQEMQIVDWEARFNNMVDQKDGEIKEERKRGNKKLLKGAVIGGLIVLLIV